MHAHRCRAPAITTDDSTTPSSREERERERGRELEEEEEEEEEEEDEDEDGKCAVCGTCFSMIVPSWDVRYLGLG